MTTSQSYAGILSGLNMRSITAMSPGKCPAVTGKGWVLQSPTTSGSYSLPVLFLQWFPELNLRGRGVTSLSHLRLNILQSPGFLCFDHWGTLSGEKQVSANGWHLQGELCFRERLLIHGYSGGTDCAQWTWRNEDTKLGGCGIKRGIWEELGEWRG